MSDPILHLTISQSPVFLLNSRLGLFTASNLRWSLFSRSYETILPSSLATDHSSALGYSPRLPVSVYGTGCTNLKFRGFSWKSAYSHYHSSLKTRVLSGLSSSTDLPILSSPSPFNQLFRQLANLTLLRHPITLSTCTGILTCSPSASPLGYTLGPD